MRSLKTQESGFSYIEVLVSLFIVSIGLVFMHSAHNFSLLNRSAKDKELALRIASIELEDLRNLSYGSLPASGTFNHPHMSNLPSGAGNYTVVDFNDDTKQVEVIVSWKESNSPNTSSVKLVTLITKNGL